MGVLLVAAPHASAADPVTDAENALRKASLYVDPSATGFKIDRAKVEGEIPSGMKIAVLPTSAGSPSALAAQIGKSLDPNASGLTVAVLTADPNNYAFGAASSAFCAGYAGLRAQAAEAANRTQLKSTHDVTALLQDFANSVQGGPKAGTSACGPGRLDAPRPAKKSRRQRLAVDRRDRRRRGGRHRRAGLVPAPPHASANSTRPAPRSCRITTGWPTR